MTYLNYSSIHSSWNFDRVAACHICKPHAVRAARKPHLYAQYRDNEVSVCGTRDKVHFALHFNQRGTSVIVHGDQLIVMVADTCVRQYNTKMCKLFVAIWPTPPEGGSDVAVFSFATQFRNDNTLLQGDGHRSSPV